MTIASGRSGGGSVCTATAIVVPTSVGVSFGGTVCTGTAAMVEPPEQERLWMQQVLRWFLTHLGWEMFKRVFLPWL